MFVLSFNAEPTIALVLQQSKIHESVTSPPRSSVYQQTELSISVDESERAAGCNRIKQGFISVNVCMHKHTLVVWHDVSLNNTKISTSGATRGPQRTIHGA